MKILSNRCGIVGAAVVAMTCGALAMCAEALSAKSASVPLLAGHDCVSAAMCLGTSESQASVTVELDNGQKHVIRVQIEPDRFQSKTLVDGKSVAKEETLPDAVIHFVGLVRYHSRPRMARYTADQQIDLAERWASLPAASKRWVVVEARQDAAGIAFYLDGHYVGRRDGPARLTALSFALPSEGAVRDARSFAATNDPVYLPLDLGPIARPGVMTEAAISPAAGPRTIEGVPFLVADGKQSVDVGVVREMKGSWALECDEHLSRTALDGMPETAHVAVPQAPYARAWVLCAVDDDPNRDPVLTARLTRFAGSGRGGAIADATVSLPRGDEALPPEASRVGSVRYQREGAAVDASLLLVRFDLPLGEIVDLLAMKEDAQASMIRGPYLDFELLGKLDGLSAQWDRRHKPDRKSTSAVHVFGVTLERSPAGLRLEGTQPGNIFHNDEKPEISAVLTATRPSSVSLHWRIHDIDGHLVSDRVDSIEFASAGEEKRVAIALNDGPLGWYGLEVTLRDDRGRTCIEHLAAFALLGKDTRKAGYDSPYGTWWFAGAHNGAGDKETAGPMLFKAGLRKTTFGWTKYTEADMAPWKVTLNQLGWSLAPRDTANKQAAYDAAETKVREMLARFPHCRAASIFHESYAHYVPAELEDRPQQDDEKTAEKGKQFVETGTFAAQFYRERFPDVKLLVGNTSSSASIVALLLRYGFDPKYIDAIGVEAVGQTGMPELLWEGSTQGIWLAREAGRKFGHDLPVTGCYEFTARTDRNLGPRRHAEWIVRDMLLCHAYGFEHINPAILHDTGNAYFNTLWGAGGLCRRNPLLYPKPAYVAVATLTKVLDQVKLRRRVETGSSTVYALEFDRADGPTVCALWTPRDTVALRLSYPKGVEVSCVEFYGDAKGAQRAADGSVDVECSTAPMYVVSRAPVDSIAIVRRQAVSAPGDFRVIDRMDDVAAWRVEPGDDKLRQPTSRGLPIRVPGTFALAGAEDAEKGPCLELKLERNGTVPDIVGEYTALRLKQPMPVAGTPEAIGLWVHGDSGWGKVIFEIEDAVGALWRTDGVYHDWPGDLAICHEGWRFIGYPFDGPSDARRMSPGAPWNSASPGKRATIQFPIKLVGLSVVMHRKALDLTEMQPVAGVLRFRDLGVVAK
jgi:hypothetical protein